MSYTALDVVIRRANGNEENYTLSLGIKCSERTLALQPLLVSYAADELNLIEDINRVHTFLLASGYGLSNCIVLSVSDLYEAE